MSITNSLSNALSGLTAAARRAEVVSANVANALTDGYGVRSVNLGSQALVGDGAGVRVLGINRHVDLGIISDRRLSDARFGDASARSGFYSRLEAVIGTPDASGSLSDRLARFENALIEAASRPDSDARLSTALSTAQDVAQHLNTIADEIQTQRQKADQMIDTQVGFLNESLQKVEALNIRIVKYQSSGHDPAALMDQRQVIIDQISSIVPVQQIPRENNKIALITPGGAILLDSKAAEIGFSPVGIITPDMTFASGALSGLTINGQPASTSGTSSQLAGGSLISQFAIRDELSVTAQVQLDSVARDLVERFQSAGTDPTLSPTDPGVFTDGGLFFDPLNEEGLSGRISINAIIDPAQGGATWHFRDGLGAVTPGPVGDATLLNNMATALTEARPTLSGGFGAIDRSATRLASDFLSAIGVSRQDSEFQMAFAGAQSEMMRALELEQGVDTDHEMQQLLLIEAAFAANAKVIQTADEMIQAVLRL